MMTPDALLLPRYKVIADYPGCSYEVGAILYVDPSGELYSPEAGYSRTVTKVMQCDVEKYTANIRPLPWYAERKKSDMPEYIKCEERVWKVTEWRTDIVGRFFPMNEVDVEGESENFANIKWHFCAEKFLPCTIADYEQWKQSKNK
jgi:hypothetical protein